MRFSAFIHQELDAIIDEWETFAGTLLPSADTMTAAALRDHCREILLAVAKNMEVRESELERADKSKGQEGQAKSASDPETAAAVHGSLRQLAGFDLVQLVAEFRAMRASVLSLWRRSPEVKEKAADQAIEEITRFNEAIDQALAESVDSYSTAVATSHDMFLAVLGHDLRSPLSGVKLTAAMLGKPGITPASVQQAALRIQRASCAMDRLITDLLEYTRARLGSGVPITRVACDLGKVCSEALDEIRTGHPERRFDQRLAGNLLIEADAARIHQVLSNLLNNAVQHGDRREPILLSASGTDTTIELQVTNAGRPIPATALQTIFEPLVQAPSEGAEFDQRSKTSMGLGLFIVREITIAHGGSVSVESSLEAGTSFTIRLPRILAPARSGQWGSADRWSAP